MTKPKPVEHVFEYLKFLWPVVDRIRPSNHTSCIKLYVVSDGVEELLRNLDLGINVNWDGAEVYPPIPEKKWRPAEFPRDWNKAARFRTDGGNWYDGTLIGCDSTYATCLWVRTQHNVINRWEECEVLVKE